MLRAAGADLEACTAQGATALHLAAGYGSAAVLQALLESDAHSHAVKGDVGWTALHYVARLACADATQELVRRCNGSARARSAKQLLRKSLLNTHGRRRLSASASCCCGTGTARWAGCPMSRRGTESCRFTTPWCTPLRAS